MSGQDRAARIRRLFDEVVVLDPQQRAVRLAEACGTDDALRREVESLLAAADKGASGVRHALEGLRPAESAEDHPIAAPGGIPAGLADALKDRYVLNSEIGRGGMATVYLAEDLKHHRNVAVKVLRPELTAILGTERFLKEIEVTANLQHPHILALHDSGEADGFLYYVMPWVDGESLRDRLAREGQLGVDETIEIARGVAGALDYAHRRDVIHRDIKPENILLHDGQPVVADFGIALALTEAGGTRLTETGLSLGTPHYMSPEQATGERKITARSDVYSLAAVVYEMLAGEPPHTGGSARAIIARVISAEPQPITDVRRTVPANVDAAVRKGLAKVPADRFARATEFTEALANPAFAVSVTRETAGASGHRLAWWQRGYAVIGSLVVATALALWGWLGKGPRPPLQVTRFTVDHGFDDISPDGSLIVYTAGGEIFVRDLAASLEPRRLSVPGQGAFFSHDGEWIVVGNYGELVKIPSAGGTPAPIVDELTADVVGRGLAWGGDDNIYVTNGHSAGLSRVPVDGSGPLEPVTALDTAGGEQSHFSPVPLLDRGILYTSLWADSSRIMVYSFETGKTTRIARGSRAAYVPGGYLLIRTRTGLLQAYPFDVESLSVTGPAEPILDGVGRFDVASNGTLSYRSVSEAQRAVVLVDWDGRETPLLPDTGAFANATMSPDGNRVLVSRQTDQGSHLWVYEPGGQARQITAGRSESWPVWSPDGASVAYAHWDERGGWSVYRKRSDGMGQVEPVARLGEDLMAFQWSATRGLLVGSTSVTGTLAVPADGSSRARLLFPACGLECNGADVSSDGRYAVYRAGRTGDDPSEIFVAEIDNWLATRQQVSVGLAAWSGRWLPGDSAIVYLSAQGEMILVSVDRTGGRLRIGERRRLFDTTGRSYDRVWDARVDPQGRGLIMVKNVGGAGPGPQTVVVLNFIEDLKARMER